MSTFLGWTIISMPTDPPAPRSIEWKASDVVAGNMSPFSLAQQTYNWQAGILRASLSYGLMTNKQSLAWSAFLSQAQGRSNIFQFGDPLNQSPQNLSASAGAVSGSGQTGYFLNTTSSGLTPGDWIQIGLRLYRVTSVSGGALGIWPQIRESPADGTSLVIANTKGIWRLTSNDRGWSVGVSKLYSVTFEIEEVI